jgi:nicotinate-nucleotide pyrophosphorylase (carboxylating)
VGLSPSRSKRLPWVFGPPLARALAISPRRTGGEWGRGSRSLDWGMVDLNAVELGEVYAELNAGGLVRRLLELARDEDLAGGDGADWELGDLTSRALVPGYVRGHARVVFRSDGVVSGLAALDEMLLVFKADVDVEIAVADGERACAGDTVATLTGDMRSILRVERTLLNLVSRLSGIATRSARFVEAARAGGGKAGVFDTRKTTPGLRVLEKYAVRCGGAKLHRIGLYDGVMIKDNHLASLRGLSGAAGLEGLVAEVKGAARKARQEAPRAGLRFVELEVDSLEQLRAVLDAGGCGVDIVLLDNMPPELLREGVRMRDEARESTGPIELEASGGVTLETIGTIAATGVERVSTGSLTHGAVWLDVGLDL